MNPHEKQHFPGHLTKILVETNKHKFSSLPHRVATAKSITVSKFKIKIKSMSSYKLNIIFVSEKT